MPAFTNLDFVAVKVATVAPLPTEHNHTRAQRLRATSHLVPHRPRSDTRRKHRPGLEWQVQTMLKSTVSRPFPHAPSVYLSCEDCPAFAQDAVAHYCVVHHAMPVIKQLPPLSAVEANFVIRWVRHMKLEDPL